MMTVASHALVAHFRYLFPWLHVSYFGDYAQDDVAEW